MTNMLLGAAVALIMIIHAEACLETNHLIEIDGEGNKVAMDVTYNSEKNTVLVIVGDVSKIEGGRQTVNLHDFNTGYGVLKDINKKTCLLGQAFTRRAMPEKYRMGVTYEVHEHILEINPEAMTKEEVFDLGGPHVATFCNDYATYLTKRVTGSNNGNKVATLSSGNYETMWCVMSSCKADVSL